MKPDDVAAAPDQVYAGSPNTTGRGSDEERLRYLASIVEGTDDAIIGKTLDGTIQSWNSGARRLYDYTPEEVIGHSISLLVPPERTDELANILARLARGERVYHLETVRIAKGGRRLDVELTISPIRNDAGTIIGASTLARDISERRRFERALRESDARNAAILEVSLDCIITIDGDGRIVEWNPAAEKTFHYQRDEVLGRLVAEIIIPPAQRHSHYTGLAHHRATGVGPILRRRLELVAMRKGGAEFPIEVAIVPIEVGGGTFYTAYLRDISERKQDEAKMERLQQEIQDAVQRQRQFFRDVMLSVTDGRLRLCTSPKDLPVPLASVAAPIPLSMRSGLRELRQLVETITAAQGYANDRWQDLAIAASEAGMNAIVHAGGGVGRVCADGQDRVQVWVEDQGIGIDITSLPRATLEKGYTTAGTLGHGMKMALQTADRVFLLTRPSGTTVVLEQDRIPPLPQWA